MNYSRSRKLGQHFLKNREKLRKIAASLEIEKNDTIVEIGPGHGELTDELRSKNYELRVIAVEKDAELSQLLKEKFSTQKNIEIIEGDALKIISELPKIYNSSSSLSLKTHQSLNDLRLSEPNGLPPITYKLVGNIPYYITGKLLRTLSELETKPKIAVLTVQKEVAERIVAKPPKMNLLAASVQVWAEPEIVDYIPKKDFSPQPKVDSAIIKLVTKPVISHKSSVISYYNLIKVLFKQPRKTILNNLSALKPKAEILPILERLKINSGDRPQNLDLKKIKELSEAVSD